MLPRQAWSRRTRFPRAPWSGLLVGVPLLLGLSAFLSVPAVRGDGSVDLSANGGKRALTEWRTSLYGGLLPRRTLFKVYAVAGEEIAMGSSAVGVGAGDIVLWTPGQITAPLTVLLPVPAFSCKTAQPANGVLDTRAKEIAGPTPAVGGYVPCTYTAGSTGVYNVAFYGPSGPALDLDGAAGTIAAPATGVGQNSGVSAWDITVRAAAHPETPITGRVFTDYLAQITGGNGATNRVDSTLYAVTRDGFKYRIDLRGLDPNGFILFGNTVGFLNPDGVTPLYHDLYDGVNNQLTAPQGGVTVAPPTGLIFFAPPAADLPGSITPVPVVPSVNSITFQGTAGLVSGVGGSVYSTGGNIVYSGNVAGIAQVVIVPNVAPGGPAGCANATYDPALPTNRVVRADIPGGVQNLTWDGKDNSGAWMPTSWAGNGGIGYCFKATLHAGEYHFPLLDAENSMLGGPTLTLLNPPGGTCPLATCRTAFFDDRGYRTSSGATVGTVGAVLPGTNPAPAPHDSAGGFDTASTTIRAYGDDSSTGFGDKKGLDLWTYFPSQDVAGQLYVIPQVAADLAITKTHVGDFTIGTPGTYRLTVRNVGSAAIGGAVTVTDPVPAGLTLVSAAGAGWACGTSGQDVTCTVTPAGGLGVGVGLPVITVTVNTTAAAAPGVTNTATVDNDNDTNPANNTASSDTTVISADLSVTKLVNGAPSASAAEGATVTFAVRVANAGPSTADTVSVADALPAGLSLVSATATQGTYAGTTWSVGTLASGANATLTIQATVDAGQSGQAIDNSATVSGGPYDPVPANDAASAHLDVLPTVLTGVITDQDTGLPIDGATVDVTDALGHHFTLVTGADGRYTVTAGPTTPLSGGVASVAASAPGYLPASAGPTIVVGTTTTQDLALVPRKADVAITKTDGTTQVSAGGSTTYTLRVTNGGPLGVTGALLVDPPAAGLHKTAVACSGTPGQCATPPTVVELESGTFALPVLANGEFYEIAVTADVTAAGGSVTNTASVALPAGTTDPNPDDNTAADTDTVSPVADLSIVKSASPDPAHASGSLTYTLAVANAGPSPATTVTVTDPLPAGVAYVSASGPGWGCGQSAGTVTCTRATLAVGAAPDITISVTVDAATLGPITNTATVSSTTFDPDAANDTDTVHTSVTPPAPGIALTKHATLDRTIVAPAGRADAGDRIDYTFDVTNTGDAPLVGVTVTDAAVGMAGCLVGPLAVGASDSATCTASHTLTQAEVDAGSYANTAGVTGTPPAGGDVTATAEATVTLPALPGLSLVKSSDATAATGAGDTITYRYPVQNTGNLTITGLAVTDPMAGLSAVDCGGTTALAPGATVTCTATYLVTPDDVTTGSLHNTGTAAGSTSDGAVLDNADLTVTLTRAAHLSLAKDVSTSADGPWAATASLAGPATVHYRLVATNDGNVTITGMTVSDPMLADLACDWTGLTEGTLPAGRSVTCTGTHAVTTSELGAGPLVNTAHADGLAGDTPVQSDTASATVVRTGTPHLSLTKTSDRTSYVEAGDVIVYTLTATNDGDTTITGVTITDARLPAMTCSRHTPATLSPGHALVCTGRYTVTTSDAAGGSVRNVAHATGDGVGSVSAEVDVLEVPPTDAPGAGLAPVGDLALLAAIGTILGLVALLFAANHARTAGRRSGRRRFRD